MALTVRLRRMGNRNNPFFRVVAADSRTSTTGRFIESLGWYDPKRDGINFKLNKERIAYWTQNGAKLSSTVKNLVEKDRKLPIAPVAAPVASDPALESAEPEVDVVDPIATDG